MANTIPTFPESRLCDEAARARRNLIVFFTMWLLVVLLGFTPTEIAVLGIKLSHPVVSVQTLVSFGLLYFWASFVVYAYADWLRWWDECTKGLGVYNSNILSYIKSVETHEAGMKALPVDEEITPQTSVQIAPNQTSTYANAQKNISSWKKNHIPKTKKLRRRLRSDVVMRTSWDYVLPAASIIGPLWYFISLFFEWLNANPAPLIFGISTV